MKLVEEITVFAAGSFPKSSTWNEALQDIRDGIQKVVWPPQAKAFTIRPEKTGNGVKPIKEACVAHLESVGWKAEALPTLVAKVLTGKDLDAIKQVGDKTVALEWETGNISSSHRAVNKLLVSFDAGAINGAILVLPSRKLYKYLTDRIGNIDELQPYIPYWKKSLWNSPAFDDT